jgi:AraC family transcriptional regulator
MVITIPSTSSQPSSPKLGQSSFLLHERAKQHFWAGTGALSIKTFAHGSAFYNVGRGQYRVEPHSYLLLNQGQWYSIACESKRPIESFCLFFADGLAEEVQYSLTATPAELLDNPQPAYHAPLHFFEKLYAHDELLSPALTTLKASYSTHKDEPEWLREQMHSILQRMLLVHQAVCCEVETLPALRATTREELYRRLHRAKDFMASCFEQPLTLDEIAGIACLSPNHFLRTFQQAFQQTPHQYLTTQRLACAQSLLRQSELSVTDICFAVGFASLGSFSSLFKRRIGVSPEQFRRAKR